LFQVIISLKLIFSYFQILESRKCGQK
jgi:hypothetical protein